MRSGSVVTGDQAGAGYPLPRPAPRTECAACGLGYSEHLFVLSAWRLAGAPRDSDALGRLEAQPLRTICSWTRNVGSVRLSRMKLFPTSVVTSKTIAVSVGIDGGSDCQLSETRIDS
jgi:hypothetical protein